MNDQKPIIVAVDDQPVILHTVASELREQYQVRPFTSGQNALKYLLSQPADLILLDYEMPVMNGCEVLIQLRSDERTAGIPVIFLTGSEQDNTEVEVLEKGASDYIQKPIKTRVLQTRVKLQLELAHYRSHLEALVEERTKQLQQANESLKNREDITLNLLAEATDLRDHDTGGHIWRTTESVRIITEELLRDPKPGYELTEAMADDIVRSSKLHDLGKIAVPDRILQKPGRLDEHEFSVIRKHPRHGSDLLGKYIQWMSEDSFLDIAKNIALSHHEKWDGTGYPSGLSGEEIPLCARITAIADVYDALTSERPYKAAYTHEIAAQIIMGESGAHFDPFLVTIFARLADKFENINARSGN